MYVPVGVTTDVWNTMIKKQVAVHHHRKSEQELKQGRNLEAGSDAEVMKGSFLMSYSPLLSLLFEKSGPPAYGWHLPQWDVSSLINHQWRKCSTVLLPTPYYGDIFFSDDFNLSQVNIKLSNAPWKRWKSTYKPVWRLCGQKNYDTSTAPKQTTHTILGWRRFPLTRDVQRWHLNTSPTGPKVGLHPLGYGTVTCLVLPTVDLMFCKYCSIPPSVCMWWSMWKGSCLMTLTLSQERKMESKKRNMNSILVLPGSSW